MIAAGEDRAVMAKDMHAAMANYGQVGKEVETVELPAIKIINGRGDHAGSLGVIPKHWRPIVTKLPWFSSNLRAKNAIASMGVAAISKRLTHPVDRPDILARLREGKDAEGNPMQPEELTAEAMSMLTAGSDSGAKSVVFNPYVSSVR